MEDLITKENEILDILKRFIVLNLEFVIIGGYAVSSYKHRFSVDADIVIKQEDLLEFEAILNKNGFRKTISKELKDYSSKFIRYEKSKASIDLLINALVSRTTNAAFNFNLLFENSEKRKISGIEKEITARILNKEVLIATSRSICKPVGTKMSLK